MPIFAILIHRKFYFDYKIHRKFYFDYKIRMIQYFFHLLYAVAKDIAGLLLTPPLRPLRYKKSLPLPIPPTVDLEVDLVTYHHLDMTEILSKSQFYLTSMSHTDRTRVVSNMIHAHRSACAYAQTNNSLRCSSRNHCTRGQQRLWSGWAGAHTDLSFRWPYMPQRTHFIMARRILWFRVTQFFMCGSVVSAAVTILLLEVCLQFLLFFVYGESEK